MASCWEDADFFEFRLFCIVLSVVFIFSFPIWCPGKDMVSSCDGNLQGL